MDQLLGVSLCPALAPLPRLRRATALALVPLDGSPQAERALPFAIAHAKASGDHLALAGIAPRPPGATLPAAGVDPPASGAPLAVPPLTLYLRWIAETLAERGLAVEVSVASGAGAQAIADVARLWGADLVIMAAHDFGGPPGEVKDLVRTVMRRAAVPVFLVPTHGIPAAREDRLVDLRAAAMPGRGGATVARQ
jgi:nucleotide-binding universal stress UspA family protein